MKLKLQLLGTSLISAALICLPAIVRAQTATYSLTSDHCTGGCGPQQPSFGNVAVTDLGGGALSFAVNLLNSNQFVNTGVPLTFAFELSGNPVITYSSLTAGWLIPNLINTNQQAANIALIGPDAYRMSATGVWEYGVLWNAQGGGHGTAGPLNFQISGNGLTLASVEQNPGGNFFAVDILSGTTGATGVVDASIALTVPEPETYGMLLAGLGLMGYMIRRRRPRG
jgi:hypothetical protein